MSAIELRDEARDSTASSHAAAPNVPSSVAVPLQSPASQDIYQQVFPQLSDLAEERNFIGIINIAELHDINVSISRYRS